MERLPFVAVVPGGPAPRGGWPVAMYGHGFTGSASNVFPASVANVRAGLATIGTHVVGHGYGERSTWQITTGGTTTSLPAYGRGVDLDDPDSAIGNTEGSSATGLSTAVGSRDALRQTAADLMTLLRAVGGTDVDGNGSADLSGRRVTYFGQSFGGIYGTMLAGADRDVARSVLNVPGGPITEIVRLSPAFRGLTFLQLQAAELLNSSDPIRVGFQEQLPLKGDAPVTATVPGALAVQDYLARVTWLNRPGSPETFAPLLRDERVIIQVAYGDETVVNPTSYTLAEAGDLFHRVSLFRNDKATPELANPHSFLLTLGHPSSEQGQRQVATFLLTGRTIDPDGAGPVWEVPVSDPAVLRKLNFDFAAVRP
jgi:pimeloyl-ACP methyl ester carboxylesterase